MCWNGIRLPTPIVFENAIALPSLRIFALVMLLPLLLLACGVPDEPASEAPSARATAEPTPPKRDREALVVFYNATDGPNWEDNDNWLSDAPLGKWEGVTIDSNGRVTDLDISKNQLSGKIPPELGSLASLTLLNLGFNELSGEIPPELGNLVSLKGLFLGENDLSGEIPSELGVHRHQQTPAPLFMTKGRRRPKGNKPSPCKTRTRWNTMVDFSKLGPSQHKTCSECGEDFTTHVQDNNVCTQCVFYQNHPEMAPKYWTWTRLTSSQWGIIARWPDKEDLPNPGDTVVVHRKNSTTSTETIREVLRTGYSPSITLQVFCSVD